jgi:hypothetical protein
MLTRSPYKAAMSSDPGGGGGGTKLEGQAARTGGAAKADATEKLTGNSDPKVDADAVTVEAAEEVTGVKVEGMIVVAEDAVGCWYRWRWRSCDGEWFSVQDRSGGYG